MPTKISKPNLTSQLKTSMPTGSIPRAGAQKPGRVGQVATNSKIFSVSGGGRKSAGSGPKRGKRMY